VNGEWLWYTQRSSPQARHINNYSRRRATIMNDRSNCGHGNNYFKITPHVYRVLDSLSPLILTNFMLLRQTNVFIHMGLSESRTR
jgi:hypothetical protein